MAAIDNFDFTDSILDSRGQWSALHSSSQNEADKFAADSENELAEKGKEFYIKQANPVLPVPERYDYNQIDQVEELPNNNYRAQQQYFAGRDVSTGVKDMSSVLDEEPGYLDKGLEAISEAFNNFTADFTADRETRNRVFGGAGVRAAQGTQHLGMFMAELAGRMFGGDDVDPKFRDAYWRKQHEEEIMKMPGALEAQTTPEAVSQEILGFMAPFIGVTKMAGVYSLARAGKLSQATAMESVAASIFAQGMSPEEGNLSTFARTFTDEDSYANAFLEMMDSKQSFEQGDVMTARAKMAAEEIGLTAMFPLLIGMNGWARAAKKANTVKDVAETSKALTKGSVTPDGDIVDTSRRDFLKMAGGAGAAGVAMATLPGTAALTKAIAPGAEAAVKAAPVVSAAAKGVSKYATGRTLLAVARAIRGINKSVKSGKIDVEDTEDIIGAFDSIEDLSADVAERYNYDGLEELPDEIINRLGGVADDEVIIGTRGDNLNYVDTNSRFGADNVDPEKAIMEDDLYGAFDLNEASETTIESGSRNFTVGDDEHIVVYSANSPEGDMVIVDAEGVPEYFYKVKKADIE